MPRANRRTPSASTSPQPNDVELACLALQEIKRQPKSIASVGGGEPSADLLVAAVDDCVEAGIVADDAARIRIVNSAAGSRVSRRVSCGR